jgi:type I restriction enzyme S subunit
MKEGWTYKKLGEICELIMGQSPESTSYNKEGEGLPFFQGCSDFGTLNPNVTTYCNAPLKIAEPLDVLMSVRAPVGTLNIANVKCCIGRGLASFRQIEGQSCYKFLYYLLKSAQPIFQQNSTGATFKAIGKSFIANFKIEYPPVFIQQQIVTELDLLSDVIEKKKAQIEEFDKLTQSTFYDMFGDPVTNEKVWDMAILKNVTIRFSDGPFGSNLKSSHYRDEGIRVIRLQNIGVNVFVDLDKAFITEDHYQKLIKYTCYPGDILIGTLGSPNLRACIIPQYIDKCINKADCVLCRVNNDIANAKYICYLLNCESFVKAACILSHGETRTRISAGQLRDYNIPLPPLTLQQEFAAKIEAIEQMKAKVRQSLKETEELFNSRMDYYFN